MAQTQKAQKKIQMLNLSGSAIAQKHAEFFILFLTMAIIIYVSFVKAIAGVFSSWCSIQQPLSIIETDIFFYYV